MRYDRAPQRRRAIAWFWHEGLASAADGPRPCHTHTYIHDLGASIWRKGGEQPNALCDPKLCLLCYTRCLLSLCTTPLKHTEVSTQLWVFVCLAGSSPNAVSKCIGKAIRDKKSKQLSQTWCVFNTLSIACKQKKFTFMHLADSFA